MTTQTLRNGDGKDLAIKPGESIQIVAVTGSYTASIIAGVGTPSVIATDATGGNYGPYATGSVIRLRSSPLSEVDFEIGTAPAVVSDTPVMASKNLTGGIEFTAGGEVIEVGGGGKTGADLSVQQYLLKAPTSAAAHGAVTGTGAITAYEVIDGVQVVSVTAAASTPAIFNFKDFSARLIPDGVITFGLYVHNMETLSSIRISIGDGAGYTNSFTVLISDSSAFPCSGWYEVVVDPLAAGEWASLTEASQRKWSVLTGSPSFDSTLLTNARVTITTDSGVACKVSFAECAIGKTGAKGQIVFVMDDGYDSQFNMGIPLLERYGMKATLGVIASQVGQTNYMTLPQLQELTARGHECVAHGATTLTSLADMAAVEAEILSQKDFLTSNGLAVNDSEKIYIYPQNVMRGGFLGVGGEVLRAKLVELGFIGARTTSVTGFLSSKFNGLGGRWMIPEIGHRAATDTEANETANVDRVILRMQQAVALGRSVVITNHSIKPDTPGVAPTTSINIGVSNFKRIVKAAYDLISTGRAENVLLSTAVKRSITAEI